MLEPLHTFGSLGALREKKIDFNAVLTQTAFVELEFQRILPGVQCCGFEFSTHCPVVALERLWLVLCPT